MTVLTIGLSNRRAPSAGVQSRPTSQRRDRRPRRGHSLRLEGEDLFEPQALGRKLTLDVIEAILARPTPPSDIDSVKVAHGMEAVQNLHVQFISEIEARFARVTGGG